jgi:hypothetical protein
MAVPAPRAGSFSLLVQRKGTKRKHTPVARRAEYARFPPLLAQPGAAQLAEREQRASGSNTCSLNNSRLSGGARRARTGIKNNTNTPKPETLFLKMNWGVC